MEAILTALQQIKRPGTFATSGYLDSCLPGLEITGIGKIGLPINDKQAKAIIKKCYHSQDIGLICASISLFYDSKI